MVLFILVVLIINYDYYDCEYLEKDIVITVVKEAVDKLNEKEIDTLEKDIDEKVPFFLKAFLILHA